MELLVSLVEKGVPRRSMGSFRESRSFRSEHLQVKLGVLSDPVVSTLKPVPSAIYLHLEGLRAVSGGITSPVKNI